MTDGTEVPVIIGTTGRYRIDLQVPMKSVQLIKRYRFSENDNRQELPEETSYITYSFYTTINSEFKHVKDINYINVPSAQFIGDQNVEDGHPVHILKKLGFILEFKDSGKTKFVLNPKLELLKIYYIDVTRRPWKPLYVTAKDSSKTL